ncbi:MAG: hypothetical protein CL920_36895 [Deltaproteobacteria bacterium]|nr:hypothetical protein [Deltaproteobacteria bacterium]MBU54309.1 hypothetical protein [Deltaproteobacteria bacterium]|tara:strand:+ start:2307 stop:3485 length:1179 start_codon:yes stop_codon:yes gene_type:complete
MSKATQEPQSNTQPQEGHLSPGWMMLAFLLLAMTPVSYLLELHGQAAQSLAPDITFERDWVLSLLWLVPGIAILISQYRQLQIKKLYSIISPRLAPQLASNKSPERRRFKGFLLTLAWLFLFVGLAGPQWGTHVRILKRKGIDVVVAVDVSESMLAKDMPTALRGRMQRRLALARKKVRYLMELLAGERIGILAFAGQPVMLCPLSTDYNTCAVWLDSFSPRLIPYGGTALASTIKRAIPMFSTSGYNSRALIMITDGDDHEKDTLKAAEAAKKKGIRVYTLGLGSDKTVTIPASQLPPPLPGEPKDTRSIITRLNKKLLQKISKKTSAIYRQAEVTHRDIRALYQHAKQSLQAKTHKAQRQILRESRFSFFVSIGLILLLFEFAFRERRES